MNTALKTTVAALALAAAAVPGYAIACTPGQTGVTPDCPIYNSPVSTLTAHPATGENIETTSSFTGVSLFQGKTPPNGFMVSISSSFAGGILCWVNDIGIGSPSDGFLIGYGAGVGSSNTFVTPPGYKPIGPVTLSCNAPGVFLVDRAW